MGTDTCKLSHKLLALGFFSALGTSEHPGMTQEEVHVGRGTPNTFDGNNGVTVIYDEDGRPWIQSTKHITGLIILALRGHNLKRGAYVPHSNDGGHFLHEIVLGQ